MTREKENKLIGKEVKIKSKDSWFYGGWGVIKGIDYGYYMIAMYDGNLQYPFTREEFTVSRKAVR